MNAALKRTIFLLLMILLLVACKTESNQTVFGKWSIIDNESDSCPDAIQLNDDQDRTFEITFSSGTILEGTYEEPEVDNHFKLYYQEEELDIQFAREGNHLIVSDVDGHDPCKYGK